MSKDFLNIPGMQATLATLEVSRKEIASKQIQGIAAIAVGIITAIIASALFNQLIIGLIFGAVGVVTGIVILYKISDESKSYRQRFKTEVIGVALCSINPTLIISPGQGIPEGEFTGSQLFNTKPDRYRTEDLISGKIDKTLFYFAEVHAEYKTETQTKNGKRTNWYDILKGIIFVADFNKNFSGVTLVKPRNIGNRISAWFSDNIFNFSDKNLIKLENQYFQDNFVTYGTDQVESRYILTPLLMDKIAALNERSSDSITISFIKSKMYVAFPLERNYFEAPTFKSLLGPEALADDMNILEFMCEIVSEMDLNTRIWTKS